MLQIIKNLLYFAKKPKCEYKKIKVKRGIPFLLFCNFPGQIAIEMFAFILFSS